MPGFVPRQSAQLQIGDFELPSRANLVNFVPAQAPRPIFGRKMYLRDRRMIGIEHCKCQIFQPARRSFRSTTTKRKSSDSITITRVRL